MLTPGIHKDEIVIAGCCLLKKQFLMISWKNIYFRINKEATFVSKKARRQQGILTEGKISKQLTSL